MKGYETELSEIKQSPRGMLYVDEWQSGYILILNFENNKPSLKLIIESKHKHEQTN